VSDEAVPETYEAALDYILKLETHEDVLSSKLKRAWGYLFHQPTCALVDPSHISSGLRVNACTCGLQAFIEEVGEI
jgi:hypothetical protein